MPKRLAKHLTQNWLFFFVLILVAQQGNFITYKWAGANVPPLALVFYVLVGSVVMNGIYMLATRNHADYPLVLPKAMRYLACWVAVVYIANEFLLMSMFHAGGPYSVGSAVFLVLSMVILCAYGIFVLRERVSATRLLGAAIGIVAIALIKLG
jgi:drug/metabolite transporter (DMT)-like permease